ncbi:hypothetical protein [Sphingobium sp.]|uniref:hypothetical protein n=1 Tax=Sphingobium sp. TaxID=1912891 RepID=UPI002D7ED588|nr:hypothetical protein [Sphingobium sp.]
MGWIKPLRSDCEPIRALSRRDHGSGSEHGAGRKDIFHRPSPKRVGTFSSLFKASNIEFWGIHSLGLCLTTGNRKGRPRDKWIRIGNKSLSAAFAQKILRAELSRALSGDYP